MDEITLLRRLDAERKSPFEEGALGEESQPILERLGFVRLTESWPCVWAPAGQAESAQATY